MSTTRRLSRPGAGRRRRIGPAAVTLAIVLACVDGSAAVAARPSPGGAATPAAGVGAGAPRDPSAVLAGGLRAALAQATRDEQIPVIVRFRDTVDPRSIPGASGRHGRVRSLVASLKRQATATDARIGPALAPLRARGKVTAERRLWIANALALRATPEAVTALAALPDVERVVIDREIRAPAPVGPVPSTVDGGTSGTIATSALVETNLDAIGAPTLWAGGDRGSGAVVASIDTGVDVSVPELGAAWLGGPGSWFDPHGEHPSTPYDSNGHGTWTTGVMVAGDATGSAVGVAPEARFIAAKLFDDVGTASDSDVHAIFQWLLDPDGDPATDDAPDVANNSWGATGIGCDLEFLSDLGVLAAAGIVPVFAAGNGGPGAGTLSSPADVPGAFAVGALDGDVAASFSARGPADCGRAAPETAPALSAPGVAIHTTDRWGFVAEVSGTSIAAPHVSGAIALLRSRFPDATVQELEQSLVTTATDLGPTGADNDTGAGRLNVAAAATLLAAQLGGPAVTDVVATPELVGLSDTIDLSARIEAPAGSGQQVDGGEAFIDVAGAPGAGIPLAATFGASVADATASISAAALDSLGSGWHVVLVHGRSGDRWGRYAETPFRVDHAAPSVSPGGGATTVSNGAPGVTIRLTASDAGPTPSGIAAAEWFTGPDPGPGAATPMTATDGAFDEAVEPIQALVAAAGLTVGERAVWVRARDAVGSWGAVVRAPFLVTPANTIFGDGFETGTLAGWSRTTGGTRLAVRASGALAGTRGLTAKLATTPAYAVEGRPYHEAVLRARMRFDPNGARTSGRAIDILAGVDAHGARVVSVQYRRTSGGGMAVRIVTARRGGTTVSSWVAISDRPHVIEIAWSSGRYRRPVLEVDGVVRARTASSDTTGRRVESIRLGPSAGLGSGVSGILRFDEVIWDRGARIGP